MFLWYADESGNRDPRLKIPQKNGPDKDGDWLYVLCAVSLFESRWHGFEKTLNRHKRSLMNRIYSRKNIRLQLSDTEVKSNWLRQEKALRTRVFLSNLTSDEREDLVDNFYDELGYHNMHIVAVLVDKRHLKDYMDDEKIHRKSWELLLEQIQKVMRAKHDKHQALIICDDVGKEMNCSLAMKHAYVMEEGTKSGTWLTNLCEMPHFVRSELSNGVQLSDLCAYNIYRAFKTGNLAYPFFERISPHIWAKSNPVKYPFSGLHVFPQSSPLCQVIHAWEKQRAPALGRGSVNLVSSGANPIEPTSGTGQDLLQQYSNISGAPAQGTNGPPPASTDENLGV
jgi:hypothetical protein